MQSAAPRARVEADIFRPVELSRVTEAARIGAVRCRNTWRPQPRSAVWFNPKIAKGAKKEGEERAALKKPGSRMTRMGSAECNTKDADSVKK